MSLAQMQAASALCMPSKGSEGVERRKVAIFFSDCPRLCHGYYSDSQIDDGRRRRSKRANDVRIDHESVHGGDLAAHRRRHVLVFDLKRLQKLIADFPIFGDFKLNLSFQSAVARWLHVVFNAELPFLLAQTFPLVVVLQVLEARCSTLTLARVLLLVTCGRSCDHTFFIAHYSESVFHLLEFELRGAEPTRHRAVVTLVIVPLTLIFEFLGFNELFDLVHVRQALRTEKFELLNGLAQEPFLENAVDEVGVLLGRVEPCKDLHLVDNLTVFFRLFALKLLHLLQVKQASFNDKLFAPDSFVKATIVELDNTVFQLNVLWRVILEKLHVGEEQLSVHVVLLLEIPALRQVPKHLLAVLLGYLVGSRLLAHLLLNILRRRSDFGIGDALHIVRNLLAFLRRAL